MCPVKPYWANALAGQPATVTVTFNPSTLADSVFINEPIHRGCVQTITLKDQNDMIIGSPITVNDNSNQFNGRLEVSFPKTLVPVRKILIDTIPVTTSQYSSINAVQLRCSSPI